MNARQTAIARQEQAIENNVAQIEANKPRPSALAQLAGRLNIDQKNLVATLRNTVFTKANDHEFAALVVVANEYGLNPMLKEIYAFPAKGGGIVPVVSVDGWIKIMNQHPQFDGYEHEDIFDGDELVAIETTIYRKDRNRPIKVTEYLNECRRKTEPWDQMPHRMLRHKSLIQCCRIAFGFSGIFDQDDATAQIYPDQMVPANIQHARLPSVEELEQDFDEDTGEIIEHDEPAHDDTPPQTDARGNVEKPDWEQLCDEIIDRAVKAQTVIDVKNIEADWKKRSADRGAWPDAGLDMADTVDREIASAKKRLGQG